MYTCLPGENRLSERLTEVVEKAGARSINYQNMESAKEFSDKCVENAEKWAPVAERLWDETQETKRLSKEADVCTACGRCASGR